MEEIVVLEVGARFLKDREGKVLHRGGNGCGKGCGKVEKGRRFLKRKGPRRLGWRAKIYHEVNIS